MEAIRRLELIEELAWASEESARLAEMIAVLGSQLDEARLRQLRIELLAMGHRSRRLKEELGKLEHPGSAVA